MRRHEPPFNGKRFLLNQNTGEIHDLDNETDSCHIDKIEKEHIHMDDSYMNCLIRAKACLLYTSKRNDRRSEVIILSFI